MDGELLCEIIKRIKGVAGIKTLLILTVTALNLSVVPRGIGAEQLMSDAQFGGSPFKQRRQIALAIRKTIGKLKEGLTILHVLCYTFTHEEYGLLLSSCCLVAQL